MMALNGMRVGVHLTGVFLTKLTAYRNRQMTPTQIKSQAPQGATHYDIEGGKAVYYKVNNLGYTMRYDGVTWYALYGALIQNYKPL